MLSIIEADAGEPVVTEPVAIPEVFASGILVPEDMGEVIRVTVYVERAVPGTFVMERVIVGRFVLTKAGLRGAVAVAVKFLARAVVLKVMN